MNATRADATHDSRANTARSLADYDASEPGDPDTVEVYVLVAHPDDTTSFVVDVFGSRDEAEAVKRELEDRRTAVSVEGFLVKPRQQVVDEIVV